MVLGLADISAEAILLAGGGRAILLQIANPAVGHGVAAHSDFKRRPVDRVRSTMTYIYTVVYGTDEQLRTVQRRVNRAHGPVHSSREPGLDAVVEGFNAFDPQLQLWVAATLYDTTVTVYERIFGRLDSGTADRIYADCARLGTSLQVPPELWPADRTTFDAYWRDCAQHLRADDTTRAVAHDLLYPGTEPPWLRALMPMVRLVTVGLLPPDLRAEFALPWNARRQRRFDATMRLFGLVYPKLPRRIRHSLKNHLLRRVETT